jgi:hypothetical protein
MSTLPYHRTCARLPLHRTYLANVTERLASGELNEAAAVAEVARALGVDPYNEAGPTAEERAEAEGIVAEMTVDDSR